MRVGLKQLDDGVDIASWVQVALLLVAGCGGESEDIKEVSSGGVPDSSGGSPGSSSNPPPRARTQARELFLPRHSVVNVASVIKLLNTTKPTAGRAFELLVTADVLVETTGKKRDRSSTILAWF
jgi:hypothetical protein